MIVQKLSRRDRIKFFQVCVRTIEEKKFMLVVTETNHGLAYDRDVKVPSKHFMMSYLLRW